MTPDAPTRHARILEALRACSLRFGLHWVSNGELMSPEVGGGDWRRRVYELRQRGHVIIMRRDKVKPTLTWWTWLGVLQPSEAYTALLDAYPPEEHAAYVHDVVRQPLAIPYEPDRSVFRYTTSDRLTCYVEEIHTAGGGTMLIELDGNPLIL